MHDPVASNSAVDSPAVGMRPCPNCGHASCSIRYAVQAFRILKCPSCSFVFSGNLHNEELLYEAYHDTTREKFDDYSQHSNNAHIAELYAINEQRVAALSKWKSTGEMLDIGCGRGYFLSTATRHGFQARGIDVSENAAHYAREQFGLQVTTRNIQNLINHNTRFDVITLWHVLEHFENPFLQLTKIKSLLSRSGVCIIEVPNIHSLKFMLAKNKWTGGNHPRYHRSFFSSKTLRRALAEAGFSQVKRLQLSYRIPHRNTAFEVTKSALNIFALDSFLCFAATR